MQYCMYLRKSRADLEAEARGEGETLKRHEKILLELARKMNILISEDAIYKEVVSGETIAARPEMRRLLADVEAGKWEGVFVVEVERLARGDTMDQGQVAKTFKYSYTKIITPMKIYDPNDEFDEEYFEFGLFMSRREYKTTNRRLQVGRFQSAKEGKYVGSIPPYGYKRVKLKDQDGYTLEPIDEFKVVQLIYTLYTKGELQEDGTYERLGVSLIVNKLNEMGVPTRKGGDWTTSTVRDILSNPVYIGKIRWNWRPKKKEIVNGKVVVTRPRSKEEDVSLFDGLHPAIIEENMFYIAQHYLGRNASLPVPARYKVMNPIAGLIVCGVCGRKMNRKPYKSGYPDTLLCTGPTCKNVSSPLHLVEERLVSMLEEWLERYKVKTKELKKLKTDIDTEIMEESLEKIEHEITTLNEQINSLHDLLEQGVYSIDTFIKRSNVLNSKIETAKDNREKLETKLKNIALRKKARKDLIPKIEHVISSYWKLKTPKEKNDLLKEVVGKAVYTKKKGGRWSGKVDKFVLELYPKLPN